MYNYLLACRQDESRAGGITTPGALCGWLVPRWRPPPLATPARAHEALRALRRLRLSPATNTESKCKGNMRASNPVSQLQTVQASVLDDWVLAPYDCPELANVLDDWMHATRVSRACFR